MKEHFKKLIKEYSEEQEWNHQFVFEDETKTRDVDINSPGYNLNKWPRIERLFESLQFEDCSFIDVGCSDGYYCIQIAKLNKKNNVIGIDIDESRIKKANLVKKIFEIDNVNFKTEDLYNLLSKGEKFETVLGLGLLHRVPDIKKCIDDLCKLSQKYIVFEFKAYKSYLDETLKHEGKTKSNKYNKLYETPSIIYVKNRLKENNFKTLVVDEDNISKLNFPRAIIIGEKINE